MMEALYFIAVPVAFYFLNKAVNDNRDRHEYRKARILCWIMLVGSAAFAFNLLAPVGNMVWRFLAGDASVVSTPLTAVFSASMLFFGALWIAAIWHSQRLLRSIPKPYRPRRPKPVKPPPKPPTLRN